MKAQYGVEQSYIINPNEIKRFEVTCVYSPPGASVDIVLVHGLNGHPQKTWTAKNGFFWPTDLLPASLKGAKARILTYGYNADVYAFGSNKSASSDMVHQHAQTLVNNLTMERMSEDCTENPIIWVAHSLGGILVKRALQLANDLTSKSSDASRSIYVSSYGIIFLGTPHLGSDTAKLGHLLQGIADAVLPRKVIESEPHLIRTLKSNNEVLQNINLHFLDIYQRFEIEMVHEAVKTDLVGTKSFIVDKESAAPLLPGVNYYGIEATHSTMCKFESKNSPGYLSISTRIRTWVQDCPPVIQSRWVSERKARLQVKENEARELLGMFDNSRVGTSHGSSANTPDLSNSAVISASVIYSVAPTEPEKPSDILFIKPPGFRPNSLFVGRQAELAELHRMLFDKKRRAEGTSTVLLQCLPGGGKSCLARQYVYTHFDDFPGGVFWVRAKSYEQLEAGFWDIACKVVMKPSNQDGNDASCRDPQQFISIVHDWFCANHEWLLVLDGIHFDHSEMLGKFIPDSKNSSMIYTSTERSVGGDYHFMNPQVIRLPLLSAREAQELLLLELNKMNPTQNDLKHSMELVQRMDFLPLVIHSVAQRLKATEEPLAKFARAYATGPKLRDLDAYRAVVDQLNSAGAIEALNLINILCFFSQHIPFEMVVLGLKALDVPVKAYEYATGRTLNNSIKILNQFALVDRSDQAPIHSSQSSKSSRDFLADDVDVIRLHSVVQDFFTDLLRGENRHLQWLKRAVDLFCRSYATANVRINNKTNAGLVGDYRSYEIHGRRLLQHLSRNEKKSPALSVVRGALELTLKNIQEEIERRTRESSQGIAQGRPDAFQTSIFDRTSSASDTDPETPSGLDKNSVVSTWGTEHDKDHVESPLSITSEGFPHILEMPGGFPELPADEDRGYDSGRESTTTMTVRPSQRTARPDDIDTDGGWQIVHTRKLRTRPPSLDLHRTVKVREKNRYKDSAGAWRAVNLAASDPRVSHETAKAIIQKIGPQSPPRGRTSKQSQAEVALTRVSKTSSPPVRDGGNVRDRGQSLQRQKNFTGIGGLLLVGQPSYAPPEAADTKYNATSPIEISKSSGGSSPRSRQTTAAINSLRRFDDRVSSLPSHLYSPLVYKQPYHSSDTAVCLLPDQDLTNHTPIYPRQTGPLPIEYVASELLPTKRDIQHEYPNFRSQDRISLSTNPMPTPYPTDDSFPFRLGAVSHQSTQTHSNKIDSSDGYCAAGYSSQPISRYPSGQSAHSAHSTSNNGSSTLEGDHSYLRRRPSLTQTEPSPQLLPFSPRILPTSYEIYERSRAKETNGPLRGLRALFGRAMKGEAVQATSPGSPLPNIQNENHSPPQLAPSRGFNPTAPEFLPRPQSQPLPPSPMRRPSPLSLEHRGNDYWDEAAYAARQGQKPRTMAPPSHAAPGGVRVGGRVIGFGDFPEVVEIELARERAERQRAERDLRDYDSRKAVVERAVSDVREHERHRERSRVREPNGDRLESGRKRGLSSPEQAIGLGLWGHEMTIRS